MQVCGCGSIHIENKDLALCSVCNRARRKAEAPKKEPKVYKLKQTPIKQVSVKKAVATRAKEKAQRNMRGQGIRWCETCGASNKPLSHSHTIPVGRDLQLEADPENQLYECYGDSDSCHYIWEHGTLDQKMELSTFTRKVQYMYKTRPQYLKEFIANGTNADNFEFYYYKIMQIAKT